MYKDQLRTLIENIQYDLVNEIILNMESEKLTIGQARKIAKAFMSTLTANSKHELLEKLYTLGKVYPELNDIYLKYAGEDYEEQRYHALHLIEEYLKAGNVDGALEEARKGGK